MTATKPPSSSKAKSKMKYKYQGVYPPTMVLSKVEEIKDTEVGHQDLVDFAKLTETKPLPDSMRAIVHSNLHLVAMFPTAAHNTEFVLQVASHYIRESRSVIDSSGHEILRLDPDFFDIVFKVPHMQKYIDISISKAQEIFDVDPNKAKQLINTQWLKKPVMNRTNFFFDFSQMITMQHAPVKVSINQNDAESNSNQNVHQDPDEGKV